MTRQQAEAQLGLSFVSQLVELLHNAEDSFARSGIVDDPVRFVANLVASALGTYAAQRGISDAELAAFLRRVADLAESGEGRVEAARVKAQARGERAS